MNIVALQALPSLPALVGRAASALANARTAAEVLDAREMAQVAYDAAKSAARLARAKNAHDELLAAVYRAQADAHEIEAQAKRRLADEYDGAQQRGEVAKLGDNLPTVHEQNSKPTAADIGLSRREIHEARQIRNAEQRDPGVVRRALDAALAEGREPTKAQVRKAVSVVLTRDDVEAGDGITDEMIEAANAANRKRVFMRCASTAIFKAEQGAGLRDAKGPEIDSEIIKTLDRVIRVWSDLRAELRLRKKVR